MSTRTFKQFAKAFGATPANIVVRLDGQEIFSGAVETENTPLPSLPDLSLAIDNLAFSWEKDTSFSGTAALEITVNGSPLLLANTQANYLVDDADHANVYNEFYYEEIDGVRYSDPFTDERIDGISVARVEDPALSGQWWWKIMPGSTFSAIVNIQASLPPPPPPPAA